MPTALLDFPPPALSILLFPFGLIVGSFANVLIHRLPLEAAEDRNVVTRPSHCPSCHAPLRWHQNIPLLSWLWLRGRCAACGWRIPFRYPLVEVLGGLVAAGSVWVFPFGTLIWWKGLLCGWALLVLFFTDFTEYFLPDAIQFPLMALGILFALPQLFWPETTVRIWTTGNGILVVDRWANGLQPAPLWSLLGEAVSWKTSLIGIVAGYGGPWIFERLYVLVRNAMVKAAGGQAIEAGMGMGDFKMLAWLGAFWGWQAMLFILFGGAALMVAFALPLIILRRAGAQTLLPFGCTLALATFPAVFYGPAMWSWYLGAMR
ncbi:MAG: prepilin peptidase [Acidobacteria bacterium]|nr:prepilin peptidase [Acidobacteriota bacterium]